MLIGEEGFVDSALSALFGIRGRIWFNDRGSPSDRTSSAYIWKWMPSGR
jgi:hypothetical protein